MDEREIHESTLQRYGKRFLEHGVSALALGWGSEEFQRIRFETLTRVCSLKGKDVLDFGCGFGDLLGYLKEHDLAPSTYIGVDVNPEFLAEGRKRHPEAQFVENEVGADLREAPQVDAVVMLGVLNYRYPDTDNWAYAKKTVETAWAWTRDLLVCDFHSSVRDAAYPAEDWINYFSPQEVSAFASQLSPRFALHHDYPSLPQREMMLVMRKADG